MSVKLVSYLFEHQNTRIRKQLGQLRKEASSTHIHGIRVAVKRMDALLLWFICFLHPTDAELFTSWFAKLKPLYKKVGHVRSVQIMLDEGGKAGLWRKYPDVKVSLEAQLILNQEKLDRFLRKFRYPTVRKVNELLQKYDNCSANHLLQVGQGLTERQEIESLATLTPPANEHWHTARRMLKTNFFVSKMLLKLHCEVDGDKAKLWAELANCLGRWHDWHIFGQRLAELACLDGADPIVVRQSTALENEVLRYVHSLHDGN